MAEKFKSLSTEQRKGIVALMTYPTVADAARQSGLAERTLYRWMADDSFVCELRAAQAAAMSAATRMLTSAMSAAAVVIRHTMTAETSTPALKLRAALGLVSVLPALRELVDFESRLAALEAAQGAK